LGLRSTADRKLLQVVLDNAAERVTSHPERATRPLQMCEGNGRIGGRATDIYVLTAGTTLEFVAGTGPLDKRRRLLLVRQIPFGIHPHF